MTGMARSAVLRHGYTLADLDRLAGIAVRRDLWHADMDTSERLDLSWSAMAEHLYASEEPPTSRDLVEAARTAVNRQDKSDRKDRGRSSADAYAPSKYFWAYWASQSHTASPENHVIERTALWQVFATLSPAQQAALLALAACDDHDKAATALGISRAAYFTRLYDGRRAFYRLWHEGEQPSRQWARDDRGHAGERGAIAKTVRRRATTRARQARRAGQPDAATEQARHDGQ